MTDHDMDARLRAAGERWRSAHETVATVDATAATTPTVETPAPHKPRRHWTLLASAAVVTAAIVVGGTIVLRGSGNGTGTSGDTAPLENTVWQLVGQPGTTSDALLQIANGKLVADDECRIVTGNADVHGDTLTVTDQVVRYKSCTDQYGPGIYEQGTKVLGGSSTYTITDTGLTISKDGENLEFKPASASTPTPSADYPTFSATPWLLVSAKDANGDPVAVAGDPTVRFAPDGTFAGSDGCNSLSGTFTGDVPRITFVSAGGTEAYCPGDRGATENAILDFMKGAVNVTVLGGEFTLTKGNSELVYRWNPEPSSSNDPQNLLGIQWRLADSGDGGYGLASGAPFAVQPGSDLVDVQHGTLRVTSASDDPVLTLLGTSQHVWSVVDGRLRIVMDDAQGRALVFTSNATSGDTPLAGTDWRLTSASDGSTTHPATSGQRLRVTGDQLTANDGVNTLGGTVAVADHMLRLSTMSTTAIGSLDDDPVRDLVDAVLTDGDVDYAISGETLTLTRGANVLTYQAHSPTADATISGNWMLTTIEHGTGPDGTASSVPADIVLRIAADGTFAFPHLTTSGNLGVGSIDFTDSWIDDDVAGPDRLDDTDAGFVFGQVLAGQCSYAIDGNALTITKDGVGAIVLTKAT